MDVGLVQKWLSLNHFKNLNQNIGLLNGLDAKSIKCTLTSKSVNSVDSRMVLEPTMTRV